MAYNTGQGYSINNCGYNSGTPGNGIDYWAVVGSIAANASQDVICLAAIDYVAPANSDNNPGTHTYLVGNWSYDNRYGSGCPYDGEGMMLDTLDAHGYKGQIVVRDNIIYRSGRYGLQLFPEQKSVRGTAIWRRKALDEGRSEADADASASDRGTWFKIDGARYLNSILGGRR